MPTLRFVTIALTFLWIDAFTGMPSIARADNHSKSIPPILKSASEFDYPPLAIVRKDGTAGGFSVDLLKAVVQSVGRDLDLRVGVWHDIKADLVDGRLDVLPLVSYSRERDEELDFTAPFLRMHGTIFVREGDTSIRSETDLRGREVLVMRGDTAHEYAITHNLTDKLVLTDTFEEAMLRLSKGKHDAVIIPHLVGLQLVRKLNLTHLVSVRSFQDVSLKLANRPLYGFEQKFCIAVQEGNKELLSLLNEGLAIVVSNGDYDKLYHKWFDPILPSPPISPKVIAKYMLYILLPTLALLGFFGIWYLNKKVTDKTGMLTKENEERRQVEQALRKSEAFTKIVMDNLPIGLAVNSIDPLVNFNYMNENFCKFYRTTRESLDDPDAFWDAVYEDPDFREKIKKKVLADCAGGDPVLMQWEDVPITREGEETSFISARNIPVPGEQLTISTVWDVTERKLAEQVRTRLNADLKEKNKELEQILYVASHDLRSPLVNIEGYSKELKYAIEELIGLPSGTSGAKAGQTVPPSLARDIEEALRFIRTSASKMDTLLTGLLQLSRTGRKTLSIQSLDMNEMISNVTDAMEFKIKEAGVEIEVGELPDCRGDKFQINQVFTNILDNALKYLGPSRPGLISVTGQVFKEQSVYCIEDNGIGIAPAHQKKVFELFHRLDPQQGDGEGLGLTIVKRILSRMDGAVRVESEPDAGSRFYVTLPC